MILLESDERRNSFRRRKDTDPFTIRDPHEFESPGSQLLLQTRKVEEPDEDKTNGFGSPDLNNSQFFFQKRRESNTLPPSLRRPDLSQLLAFKNVRQVGIPEVETDGPEQADKHTQQKNHQGSSKNLKKQKLKGPSTQKLSQIKAILAEKEKLKAQKSKIFDMQRNCKIRILPSIQRY